MDIEENQEKINDSTLTMFKKIKQNDNIPSISSESQINVIKPVPIYAYPVGNIIQPIPIGKEKNKIEKNPIIGQQNIIKNQDTRKKLIEETKTKKEIEAENKETETEIQFINKKTKIKTTFHDNMITNLKRLLNVYKPDERGTEILKNWLCDLIILSGEYNVDFGDKKQMLKQYSINELINDFPLNGYLVQYILWKEQMPDYLDALRNGYGKRFNDKKYNKIKIIKIQPIFTNFVQDFLSGKFDNKTYENNVKEWLLDLIGYSGKYGKITSNELKKMRDTNTLNELIKKYPIYDPLTEAVMYRHNIPSYLDIYQKPKHESRIIRNKDEIRLNFDNALVSSVLKRKNSNVKYYPKKNK